MANLNIGQLVQLAREAGFPEQEVPIMAAIGMAESGGRAQAHNPNRSTGDNSYGLFQINMIDKLGEERRRQFGLSRNEDLFDPRDNTKVARAIRDSQGLDAWSVHRSGAYKQYLAAAQAAARGGSAQPSAPSAPASSDKKGADWLSAFLAPLDASSPAATAAGSRQMSAFMAPLAAAALAMPSLKTTGQPLAGYRMQDAPSPNALSVAAKALVQSGPLSALQPEPLAAPAVQNQAPAAGADQLIGTSLPQLGTTGERVDMGPRNISSIVPDRNQPGFDLYFEDKRFPAILPGRVKEIGRQGNQQAGYGNFVVVESPDPKTGELVDVLYGHLADGSTRVKEGDPVYAGQPIGTQGGTGSVRSGDGTISSVDFLHPAPKGSGSMTPYRRYQGLVDEFSRQFRIAN